jgi:nuclear factor related to kappa-B-binding protein
MKKRMFRGEVRNRFKFGSTVKSCKNSLHSSDMRVRGSKGKSSNKNSWNEEDNNKISRAEVNDSPKKCEDTESDLSQKGVVEPVFDSGKPKKKMKSKKAVIELVVNSGNPKKKIKSKKEALSTYVQADPLEGKTSHTKGRKIGKKRKPVVNPCMSEKLTKKSVLSNENFVPEKVEENGEKLVDAQLVEVPVLIEIESRITKQKKKMDGEHSMKKRKHEKLDSDCPAPQSDDTTATKKKRGRKKLEPAPNAEAAVPIEEAKSEEAAPVPEPVKPLKKAYVPITPTVHTGFSFSIVHLLSAILKVMVKVDAKVDILPLTDNFGTVRSDEQAVTQFPSLLSLTLMEIVEGVRLDSLDMSIFQAPEHLNELIRGALRIFSSKHAPLGAKAWKPLVSYTSSKKSWVWEGPVVKPTDDITADGQTSPEMWGLPQKSLVKLVDSFANWLKQGEEILKRISSLPPPPVPIHANLEEKDRFKEIKSLKSQNTICPCSDEVRSYCRMEEAIRYSIPDRAFMYTATDGRKSTVAPLGRGGGKKMSTKARDHFMLKPDRPPHITILGLVRDAASRLPGSIGTRADVCTLIRDSQFIVDDVADEKVSEVVSEALDRLHYEQDPCVKFDSVRKLWVYLHREREEEDFEDEGTSSTKKWKKLKKEAAESTQIETVNNGEASNVNNGMMEVGVCEY